MDLALENVSRYLRYEPETGNFYWIADSNPRGPSRVGQLAGCVNAIGYWQIGLFGSRLLGHRLAWLFIHGYYPDYLDHINGQPWDNRLCNLREATQSQNIANADYGEMRGIEKHGGQRRIEVGSFATLEQAKAARDTAYNERFGAHSYFNRE